RGNSSRPRYRSRYRSRRRPGPAGTATSRYRCRRIGGGWSGARSSVDLTCALDGQAHAPVARAGAVIQVIALKVASEHDDSAVAAGEGNDPWAWHAAGTGRQSLDGEAGCPHRSSSIVANIDGVSVT